MASNIGVGYGFSITKSIKIQKNGCEYNTLFGFMLLVCSGIGMLLDSRARARDINTYCWGFILTSIPLTAATQLYANGLALTKNTGLLGMFMTVSVIVSYIVDVFRYHSSLNPLSVVGSLMIIGGISMAILYQTPNQDNSE
jgi:drug/metabolite transporter (DMT)-like permease